MSVLILMRHGRAAFGADTYDTLSETGRAQAVATGSWFAAQARPVSMVWHGPRRRQIETAAEVVCHGRLAAPVAEAAGLDEFGEGDEVLKLAAERTGRPMSGPDAPPHVEQLRAYNDAIAAWASGESALAGRADFVSFRRGVRDWLEALRTAPGPSGRVELAVTSAGVIAAVACEVLGLPDSRWIELLRALGNASLSEIVFSARGHGLASFNATGHLPRELQSAI